MYIVICPGIHNPSLTQQFLQGLLPHFANSTLQQTELLVFPVDRYPAYSGFHVLHFLQEQFSDTQSATLLKTPLVFVGFSAGVVGAIGAAWGWRGLGRSVSALIAIDGWGVPLSGDFPIHRMSHDHFTYWSSALLGAGTDSFYADPAVAHLDLWRSPQTVNGWWVSPDDSATPTLTTAASYLTALLCRYTEQL